MHHHGGSCVGSAECVEIGGEGGEGMVGAVHFVSSTATAVVVGWSTAVVIISAGGAVDAVADEVGD